MAELLGKDDHRTHYCTQLTKADGGAIRMENRIVGTASMAMLVAAYSVIRFLLFDLHGLKGLPLLLFLVGAGIITVTGLVQGGMLIPLTTDLGYMGGFLAGVLIRFDWGDDGVNALWIIWSGCFAAAVAVAVVLHCAMQREAKQ